MGTVTISRRRLGVVLTILLTVGMVVLIGIRAQASTATTTIRPSGNVSAGWTPTPAGAGTNYQRVDEAVADDADYVQAQNAVADEYTTQDISADSQRATNILLRVRMTRQSSEDCTGFLAGTPQNVPLLMGIRLNGGSLQTVSKTVTGANGTYSWYEQNFSGSFTQADINTLQVYIAKSVQPNCAGALGQTIQAVFRVSMIEAVISWESPDITEEATRLYVNTDSTTPGAPLAATNAVAEVHNDTPFRMRMALKPSAVAWQTDAWGAHNNTYTVQYATKTAATCSAQATGWVAVAVGSGAIRWKDNASVADGAAIASYVDDPTTSGSKVYQTYRESNNFGLINSVPVGNASLWDLALQDVGSTPGTVYCLRMVKSTGTALAAYTGYGEVRIIGDYGVSVVDTGGLDVASPSVAFPTVQVRTACQSADATLGVSSQKLRVTNDVLTGGWDVSIAATDGVSTVWDAGSLHYDYNDISGCTDDVDTDAYGGSLQVDPTTSSMAPKSGCTTTGISIGSQATFTEASIDAISLATANASSERFCYWDMTGVSLYQLVPAGTQSGSYTIDMTITMTAQ